MENFDTAGIDSSFYGAYDGPPGGTHGKFNADHCEQLGDGLLRLKFFSEAGADPADNNNAGAGLQTVTRYVNGMQVHVAKRCVQNPNVVGMVLLMGDNWNAGPEIDFSEGGAAHIHPGPGINQISYDILGDQSAWHVSSCLTSPTKIDMLFNYVSFCNGGVTLNSGNTGRLLENMFLSAQIQDGDGGYPSGPISASALVEMDIDWIVIDVPA